MAARTNEIDMPCPACGAPVGEPCQVPLSGIDTTGWSHDARILAPIYADLRAHAEPKANS